MKRKLNPPQCQVQEVLYELITRLQIDRRIMMLSCNIWNLPARILDLRKRGLIIKAETHKGFNKYKREVQYVTYSLSVEEKKKAIEYYGMLQKTIQG